MGKLTAFEVILTGDEVDLFRAGDLVEGYVRIVCSAVKKGIRGKLNKHNFMNSCICNIQKCAVDSTHDDDISTMNVSLV